MELINQKHIHFIGICGVAMSALALAFQKNGWQVTGSDKGFYPPVSDNLHDADINFYPGWHPEKMVTDGDPDLVVVGNVAGSKNAEWLYVQKHKIPYMSYPEVIAKYFVKEKSIVCAGTYGKSTSTAILTWILNQVEMNPTHMFGGISMNDMPAAAFTDSDYSILEGDEYKTARWDNRPKFAHYSPTHLLLTSVVWDHADVYPTEQSYIDAFANLAKNVDGNGLLVLSAKVVHDVPDVYDFITKQRYRTFTYGKGEENDYQYFDVKTTKEGITFKIKHNSTFYILHSELLGDYMADNMTGCFAMAHQLGIDPEKIIKSLASFKNIKRRLEKRFSGSVDVFDDIAHSPKKVEAVLRSLADIYTRHPDQSQSEVEESCLNPKLIAIFEPNSGNRLQESKAGYDNMFRDADIVIIPRLTTIKQDKSKPTPMDGIELAETISKTHGDVHYIENDDMLVSALISGTKKDDCIVFLGSHGFRGMIDQLVRRVKQSETQ
jgi:UDP-N-acetylmuramate: L-alanyl-gamma-D-glutamyl-meso-diaminopimelate ligase